MVYLTDLGFTAFPWCFLLGWLASDLSGTFGAKKVEGVLWESTGPAPAKQKGPKINNHSKGNHWWIRFFSSLQRLNQDNYDALKLQFRRAKKWKEWISSFCCGQRSNFQGKNSILKKLFTEMLHSSPSGMRRRSKYSLIMNIRENKY